jgi:hypothetical protein
MGKKLLLVLVAALIGGAIGAALGYGPLLHYRSEGTFGVQMTLPEYQRFTEIADSPAILHRLAGVVPLPALTPKETAQLDAAVSQGRCHTPVPRISKADAQNLPDALLQLDANAKRYVFTGVKVAYVAHDPARAAQLATWLGGYFREVAAHEALHERVRRWAAEAREFADDAPVRRLQYAFDIAQAQARAKALKGIVANYPEAARRDSPQGVEMTQGGPRFMSPMAQLVGAESEVIGIQEKLQKLDRESDQRAFVKPLVAEADAVLDKAPGGSDAVAQVTDAITRFASQARNDADKEILASMAAEVSRIRARLLTQAQFIAAPSIPGVPERPSPRTVILLCALLAALLTAAFVWRSLLIKLRWEDDRDEKTEKAA